jgi:hypothetical protein
MIDSAIRIPRGSKLKSHVSIMDIIINSIIWLILSAITFGLAFFFYIYYFNRFIINKTDITDASGNIIGTLKCQLSFGDILSHSIVWILLTIVTLGLGLFFYFYKVLAFIISKTEVDIYET